MFAAAAAVVAGKPSAAAAMWTRRWAATRPVMPERVEQLYPRSSAGSLRGGKGHNKKSKQIFFFYWTVKVNKYNLCFI